MQRSNTRKVIANLKKHNKTQEVKAKKIYIGNLNENVTKEDIYKFFGLKTTEYRHQTSSADLKMSEKAEKKTRFWHCYCTRICFDLTYRAKWCRISWKTYSN